ncbi:thermonuclease family protein [Undibacter mobilis]|uniref:Thermonuclease family protein n=1 Tax=Undibacter mobilis TaxID=2292256 RepID=A0A371B8M8_9BRAD|nr:thermonuclease family protein [Undibacter mobilis]RDV03783.1 thermonuclease family protein [Undibacter mobilis]
MARMIGRALIASALLGLAAGAPARAECSGTPAGTGVVTAVRDGRTLLLADGREIRLAGIEASADGVALRALVAGQALRIERISDDRYGRVVAFAYIGEPKEAAAELLQIALLKAGQARVSARPGPKSCAQALLSAERTARAASLGLWADPNFAPLRSQNLTISAPEMGQFALIEGQVLSVRESGATIYVNFGRRWTRDFAVTIPKREARNFAAAGIEPKMLERRRVRVRGILERRSGPIIDVTVPEQIELID